MTSSAGDFADKDFRSSQELQRQISLFFSPAFQAPPATAAAAAGGGLSAKQSGLPWYVLAMDQEVQAGPCEWMLHALGTCPCGNCARDGTIEAVADEMDGPDVAYVDATIRSDDPAYNDPIPIRIMAGASFGDESTWPTVRFMDSTVHLGLGEDGFVKPEMFELFAERYHLVLPLFPSLPDLGTPATPSVQHTLQILFMMLRRQAPECIFGENDENPEIHRMWKAMVQGNEDRLNGIRHYRTKALSHELVGDPAAIDWRTILEPNLANALSTPDLEERKQRLLALICKEADGVYSFPVFTPEFCETLVAELENVETSGLKIRRPNSMNNYGVVVNEIGMAGFMSRFQTDVSQSIATLLFPLEGRWVDSHHSFSVRYKAGEDLGLDMHTDDSDVTFNVCLGKPGFTAAGLTFCGVMGAADHRRFQFQYRHEIGRCVVHRGRQRHGADDIDQGTRVNLIMWNKSLAFRRRQERKPPPYAVEGAPPSLQCLSYTHDRDYSAYKPIPLDKRQFARGWCPPRGKEYIRPTTPGGAL